MQTILVTLTCKSTGSVIAQCEMPERDVRGYLAPFRSAIASARIVATCSDVSDDDSADF